MAPEDWDELEAFPVPYTEHCNRLHDDHYCSELADCHATAYQRVKAQLAAKSSALAEAERALVAADAMSEYLRDYEFLDGLAKQNLEAYDAARKLLDVSKHDVLGKSERECEAYRALIHWAHRGARRGLDARDGEVLIISSDRVVFIGKTAVECVENMPALAGPLDSDGAVRP